MRIASFDIGTNTLLLLVMDYQNNKLEIVEDHHKIARLGEDLNQTGYISENALKRALDIAEFYSGRLEELKPDLRIACATSAMRDASNSYQIKEQLEKALGTKIDIISGQQEAALSYLGSVEFDKNTVIDIGGGSTEIIQGTGTEILHSQSVDIGAVRITEMFDLWEKNTASIENAKTYIKEILSVFPVYEDHQAVAVAGTPNTIATLHLGITEYSRDKLHMLKMNKEELELVIEMIIKTSKEDLVNIHGVHQNRADVILGGSLILQEFLEHFKMNEYYVSSNGLRFGLIKEYVNGMR